MYPVSATKLSLMRLTAPCIHLYPDTSCSSAGYLYPTTCIWCKRGLRMNFLLFTANYMTISFTHCKQPTEYNSVKFVAFTTKTKNKKKTNLPLWIRDVPAVWKHAVARDVWRVSCDVKAPQQHPYNNVLVPYTWLQSLFLVLYIAEWSENWNWSQTNNNAFNYITNKI